MEQKRYLVCPEGREAITICKSKKCTKKPFVCMVSQCSCSKNHQKCLDAAFLNRLTQDVFKEREYTRSQLEEVAEWCQNTIKKFTLFYEEIKYTLESSKPCLTGDERKLNDIINHGKEEEITKELIINALESIEKSNEKNNIENIIDSVKNQLMGENKKIEQIILRVRNFLDHEYRVPLKFSQVLHHQTIQVTDKIIRMKGNDIFALALLQPIIEQSDKIRKFQFKINKTTTKYIGFGLAHKEIVMKNNYQTKQDIGGGVYSIWSANGFCFSHGFSQQNSKPTNIKQIGVNDIVEVAYDSANQKMIVTKLSIDNTNQSATLFIKKQQNSAMCLAIFIRAFGDEVEFLGETTSM